MNQTVLEMYMRRCFELAKQGLGRVAPNPLVGCVIVANDRIIGEGYHEVFGESHAEVNAINAIDQTDEHLLQHATLFVNLEPCNHFGKTPPCSSLIVEKGIPNVVVCNVDQHPIVNGSGIEFLRNHGVNVTVGILENEGQNLNKRFFTFIEKNRPFIILKWAQTNNHFFAKLDGKQHWITNELSKKIVHKWRAEEGAILVGKQTVKIDNPNLTNRFFEPYLQPVRVVIDKELTIETTANIYDKSAPTIFVNSRINKDENNLHFWQFEFDNDLLINLLQRLVKENIQSIIVEGGAITLQHFIDQNLWDEARILTGDISWETGISAPTLFGEITNQYQLKNDTITILKNKKCTI